MSDQVDCVVIGAGVVGLAVARQLAEAGREVIVLERTYEGKRASPLAEIMTRAGYRRETTIGANDVYTRS